MEPYRLRKWRPRAAVVQAPIYTCARPGRSKDKKAPVPDSLVDTWVQHLPPAVTVILSILGRKNGPAGQSEFFFYTFTGGLDSPVERSSRPTFQEWLNAHHPRKGLLVEEIPTYDGVLVPPDSLAAIADTVTTLLNQGHCPIIVDSGGLVRMGQLCKHMDLVEDFTGK